MTPNKPLQVGDRVIRPRELGIHTTQRHGIVTRVYESPYSPTNMTHTLYAVRWNDTGLEERGYLDGGLKREAEEV